MSKLYRVVKSIRHSHSVVWTGQEILWQGSDLNDEYIEKIYNPRFDKPINYGIKFDQKISWELSSDGGETWEEILPPRELVMQFSILGVRRRRV